MHYLISYSDNGTIAGMFGSTVLEELAELASGAEFDGALIIESDEVPVIQDKVVRDGRLVDRERNIDDVRREAIRRVYRVTAAQRAPHVTMIRGQGLVHLKKSMEAKEYLALSSVPNDLSDFPLLEAEIGVSAGSADEVARLWIEKAKETDAALARIERARMEAKAAIWKAGSEAEIEKVLKGFEGA